MGIGQRWTYGLAVMFLRIAGHSWWTLGIQMTVVLIASFQVDVVDAFVRLSVTQLISAALCVSVAIGTVRRRAWGLAAMFLQITGHSWWALVVAMAVSP